MQRTAFAIIGLLTLFILPSLTFEIISSNHIGFNFDPTTTPAKAPLSPIILSLIMLAGIFFGTLNAEMTGLSKIDILAVAKGALQRPRFWQSLLAAPIIFSGVYAATKSGDADPLLATLFAFQNGFFCEAILREREEKPAAMPGH